MMNKDEIEIRKTNTLATILTILSALLVSEIAIFDAHNKLYKKLSVDYTDKKSDIMNTLIIIDTTIFAYYIIDSMFLEYNEDIDNYTLSLTYMDMTNKIGE